MINTPDQIRVGKEGARRAWGRGLGRWGAGEGGDGGEKGPEEQQTGEVGAREATVGRTGPQQEGRGDRGLREEGPGRRAVVPRDVSTATTATRPRAPAKKHSHQAARRCTAAVVKENDCEFSFQCSVKLDFMWE